MSEKDSNSHNDNFKLTFRKLTPREIMQEKIRLEEKRRHDEASFLYTAREEGINIGIGKSFMLMVKNGVDPKKAAELLDYSVTDFKDELYCLQDTLEGFNAEDYLGGEDKFEM